MYGIFCYIYHKNQPDVGKYTTHGWYGYVHIHLQISTNHGNVLFQQGKFAEKKNSTSAGRTAGPVLLALALAGGGTACHETDDEKR